MNITDEEMAKLEASKSEQEWTKACDEIKAARNGNYPGDWWPKVMQSGFANRVLKSFGSSGEIKITTL